MKALSEVQPRIISVRQEVGSVSVLASILNSKKVSLVQPSTINSQEPSSSFANGLKLTELSLVHPRIISVRQEDGSVSALANGLYSR